MPNTKKTVIVTGGSHGIGAGVVKAFLERLQRGGEFEEHHQVGRVRGIG